MDSQHLAAEELEQFIRVLEGQRNAALTELARIAARATVLERQVQELTTLLAKRTDDE